MSHESIRWTHPLRVRGFVGSVAVVWTFVVAALLWAEIESDRSQALDITRTEARATAQRDRIWMTIYDHVYLSVANMEAEHPGLTLGSSARTVTLNGDTLALMSPALLAKEVAMRASRELGTRMRLTSLKPGNKANAPDEWESKALRVLEAGAQEYSSVEYADQEPVLRYMSVLRTERHCLHCHADEGFREGDIRGGISSTTPLAPVHAMVDAHTEQSLMSYGLLWILGMVGLYGGARRLRERIRERDLALDAKLTLERRFRAVWEQSRDAMRLIDEEGRIILVNYAYCRMVGKSRDELEGMPATIVAPKEDEEVMRDALRNLFDGVISGPVVDFEMPLWNGQTVSCERSDAIVMLSPGERVLLSIFRDLAERRRVENALSESEERLRLETLRTRIAADIHDDIGSTLSSISIFADMLVHEVPQTRPRALELANRVGADLRRVQDSLHEIVWTLNPENDTWDNIALRIHEHAVDRLEAAGIQFRIDVRDGVQDFRLPMESRRHFYLIFKEAINNLVRHSRCHSAVIRLEVHDSLLCLTVWDDGNGFDSAGPAPGNGIANMERRAAAIGGTLVVTSTPGHGTTVSLSVPVA